ncbi:MAG: hypothetical protein ACI80V_003449 [Rhodothermales bacterium]|jgi:hypothetical protein
MAFPPPASPRWGFDAHRLINRTATAHLPAYFWHFAQWADDLERLSIAADERKCCDPEESIKHYIDIDDYPEFFSGQLPRTYADMVTEYGQSRVDGNGTVPWAIEAAYQDLVRHFASGDWENAVTAAADLGHCVEDLRSPLHLTLNFNGQLGCPNTRSPTDAKWSPNNPGHSYADFSTTRMAKRRVSIKNAHRTTS